VNRILYKFFSRFNLPRGFVLLVDMVITASCFYAAYILRLNSDLGELSFPYITWQLVFLICPVYLGAYLFTGSYRGIIRHSTIDDAITFSVSVFLSASILLWTAFLLKFVDVSGKWFLPYSVVLIHAALVSVMVMGLRLVVRSLYYTYIIHHKGYRRVLIYGTGETGKVVRHMLENLHHTRIHVVGFIDNDKSMTGKRLMGKRIYSEEEVFGSVLKDFNISEIIWAVERTEAYYGHRKEVFDKCLSIGIHVREAASVDNFQEGLPGIHHLRDIKIEDLLGRESIELDMNRISKGLKDSVVLVTGAAGSIGSEIVRQLLSFDVARVVMVDHAESPLYDLQNELLSVFPANRFEAVLASITDRRKMRAVFEKYRPAYVFNAAAYKHVPMMEASPYEAVRVNVGGTCLLADLSVEFGVKKFVMISTDKAINPTNVMGASKRICEIYIQALSQSDRMETQFITTRFGNVLGSNGSVIPLFKKQIEQGGPVTVTHKDIIRYFMTIPEACQLVLEAGFMGKGGEIYLFDMGEPVKIYDLACKMISLAGFQPEVDIAIQITGLRPGEKLYEELLNDKEKSIPTHHPKIRLASVPAMDSGLVKFDIDALMIASQIESDVELVCRMKSIVPEFVSQNSRYAAYDRVIVRSGWKGQRNDIQLKRKTKPVAGFAPAPPENRRHRINGTKSFH